MKKVHFPTWVVHQTTIQGLTRRAPGVANKNALTIHRLVREHAEFLIQ